MFMLNAKAQVDYDQFVFDAAGQNNVEEYTLDAENQVCYETLVQHAGAQDFDCFEGETTKRLEFVCKARPGL